MKTCYVCSKEYSHVSPLFATVKLENETERKISNFCNIACAHAYALLTPAAGEGKLVFFPTGSLSMCQFCGSFTHPMEYCTIYGTPKPVQESFQELGNCLGEHASATGSICIAHLGEHFSATVSLASYTSEMIKTLNDKTLRNELLYFWDDPDFVNHHADGIQDTSILPITHTKEFITSISLTPHANKTKTIFLIQLTSKIINPHKLFFPFNIGDDNCWLPIHQDKETKEVLITSEGTIYESDFITTFDSPPEVYEKQEDINLSD